VEQRTNIETFETYMRIKYINPVGRRTPDLFNTFEETFLKAGHSVTCDVKEADIIFWDWFSGLGNFDSNVIGYVLEKKLPIVVFDMTDFGAMSKERWNAHKWILLNENNKLVYFMRKMIKNVPYPKWVYPFEVCMYPDHNFEPTTKEELFNRPYDICFIGNTSPTRESVCNELSKHFKCDFILGQPRIEHDEWLRRHRQAKFFLSADGGGFSDERPYQLIRIAPMIKNRNDHLQLNPFQDATKCIEVNEVPHPIEIANIKMVLNDKNWLYSMYLNGVRHMGKYYNFQYRAEYILTTIKQHLNLA